MNNLIKNICESVQQTGPINSLKKRSLFDLEFLAIVHRRFRSLTKRKEVSNYPKKTGLGKRIL